MTESRRVLPLLLVLLAACGGSDPSAPSAGILAVTVSGLPSGADAAVAITGPASYRRDLTASETLTGLAPGVYTVAATAVASGTLSYAPTVPSQTVNVTATTATANVVYSASGSSLTVNVSGVPAGASAAVHVSGPNGYDRDVTATTTLPAVTAGPYTITAQAISSSGTAYNPTPGSQLVNVPPGGATTAAVGYTAGGAAGFNLRIDGMYLTQSVQTYGGTVPLVKDRDAYLRIFVTASEQNVAAPPVRVRFFVAGVPVSTIILPPPGLSVPLSPDEGTLASSWNTTVSKTLIQPGLSILADVDPDNIVTESDETDNQFPASGSPLPLEVRTTSAFSVRLVPVVQDVNLRQGNVSNANKDSYLSATMKIHPLAAYDADVHAPWHTDAPAVDADNSNNAWTTILSQLDAARTAESSSRYYFGVINTSYSAGVAGIGAVGGYTAMGWDRSGADWVAAHEWGHNWGRRHAPCGNPAPSTVDGSYPYARGATGAYGLDLVTLTLKPPSSPDLMGYCDGEWVSDYNYQGILAWREAQPDVVAGFAQAMQPCLLVWGRVEHGQAVLEPAFQVVARPRLPARAGAYTLDGHDAAGARMFHVSFTPEDVPDDPQGGRVFAYAVPLQADRASRLQEIRLSTPGQVVSLRASGAAAAPADVRAMRSAPGRVALRWDASAHPMAMVRDQATGQVLSFARGGAAEIATGAGDLEVQLSNGVAGRSLRVSLPPR